ncbi:glycerophosphocholine phosphodiesterase [Trichophyton mentagrophytes]|nr:glycerophosphocholine phosphodiesterase [Trichophyton mentagrophytes]
MKFEEKFLSLQALEWRPVYLPYRRLKAMLKLPANGRHPPPYETNLKSTFDLVVDGVKILPLSDFMLDFMLAFRCALNMIKAFVDTQFLTLKGKESVVLEPYKRARHGTPSLTVEDQYLIYGELLEDYDRLHMFIRLNYEASQRINSKVEKSQRIFQTTLYRGLDGLLEEQAFCERQCLTEIERLQGMINSTRQGSKSLPACNLMSLSECSNTRVLLTTINNDILADQSINLSDLLGKIKRTPGISKDIVDEVFNTSLTRSIVCRSWSCTSALIENYPEETLSSVSSSWLNGLLLAIFRHSRLSPISSHERDVQMREDVDPQNLCVKLFNLILNHAGIKAKELLITPDAAGAISLQYSAQLGLPVICDFIIKYLEQLGISPRSAILAANTTGIKPLQWSVARGHVHVTRIFLDTLYVGIDEAHDTILNDLLTLAIEYQNDGLVQLLASRCTTTNQLSSSGETCLHVASRVGRRDYIDTILKINSQKYMAINAQEGTNGWTPLTIASIRGHLPVVEALLCAGANEQLLDYQGWTAKDHAAFKGHFAVANRLETNKVITPMIQNPCITTSPPNIMGDTTYLIVNLGTVQKGRKIKPLDLEDVSTRSGQLLPETALSLEISTSGGPAYTLRLPFLRDLVDDTFIFPIEDPLKTHLAFKLLKNTSHSNLGNSLIGSGISLLSSKKDANISYHKSLIRESTVPILEKETMELIGKITFTSFIATPFLDLNTRSSSFEYLEKTRSMQLIGHRGSGQNTADRGYLQLGENTIQSFMSAANLGASHVEFDVQLTRDLIPVLYHDLSLSESGTDVAIHDLTLKQFIHASDMQLSSRNDADNSRSRSRSLSRNRKVADNEARLRMKHTLYFSNNGAKHVISAQSSCELLLTFPTVEYPRIHEAYAIEMAPIGIELNTFVDTILTLITRYAGSRNIILSSFTPEICILLAIKQKAYPIFFITNAGKLPIIDKEERAGSVQVAVRFATKWGLAGVVFASDVIVMCPQLVNYVKSKGLVCATYGPLNNIPESVELQAKSGVDLLVADRVALVSKTLKGLE